MEEICKEIAPKIMPIMLPKALENFLMKIPEKERDKLIMDIVDIIVSKTDNQEISSKFVKEFESILNIKGLKIHSRGGKGAIKEKISPMDTFLSGLCGCIAIAVGNTLLEKNIEADINVKGSVEKNFEKGCIEKIKLDIYVKPKKDVNKEELKTLVLKGSNKCLISNSLKCEVIKNVIIE
ncbi:OsmC family protein [Methanocaldococcus villosus KIN24-T80]|uniref:OsmC family protein n=1 Tax=Methanocaldococcus villosus KIN24-T80 TaxID=1069083 RepID=N6VSK0_9EURY|nr:OsmC family protein [Methanocaldococcus villosus]ENN96146.1 OsmC family protein [Methanocaldococcus villosus KIN24-T80]